MRLLVLAMLCGCPAVEIEPELPEMPAPSVDEPLPPSNCARGTAPPVGYCRERREGYSVGTSTQSSQGAVFIQDWTNVTSNAYGHVETIFGDGFPIERHETGTFAGDMTTICDASGRVSIQHTWSAAIRIYYDTANRMRSYELDEGRDGVFETRDIYSYDEAGNMIRGTRDSGAGTPIEAETVYEYDERNRMMSATVDRDADGDIDQLVLHEWDELDREVLQEQYEHHEIVARWRWTYDGARQVTTELEGNYRWTNSHDERDRVIGVEFLDLVAGRVDAVSTMRYDDLDRRTEYVEDTGVDGTVDARVTWEYCD